jgi:hypothetical protein
MIISDAKITKRTVEKKQAWLGTEIGMASKDFKSESIHGLTVIWVYQKENNHKQSIFVRVLFPMLAESLKNGHFGPRGWCC